MKKAGKNRIYIVTIVTDAPFRDNIEGTKSLIIHGVCATNKNQLTEENQWT